MQPMKLVFFVLSLFVFQTQAQDLGLSQEWLQLLHMRKSILGQYESSVRGEGFFLSPQGSRDPVAEFQATKSIMFGTDERTARKTQCQFLARRDFFLRHGQVTDQNRIYKCEFSDQWLQKLNATKVTLVFAAAYLNSAPSSFGHTFLKLQNPENEKGKDLLNYGINFAARTANTEGALYALYGLTGVFPGTFAMLPYHQMIKEYTHLEGRDLWEYELDLSKEEVRRLLYHLLELDKVHFEYYFLDDNCSFALLKLLEVARPGLELVDDEEPFVIPLDTVKKVESLVKETHYRPSLATEWKQRQADLNESQQAGLLKLNENTQPEDLQELDVKSLTAAQYLVTLRGFEDHARWAQLNYFLSRERAKRGAGGADLFQIQKPAASPITSPDSSAVEVGVLDQKANAMLFGVRAAFHDQLSRNEGASPFSHLEVLAFQWQAAVSSDIRLRRYRLLETLSTETISRFGKPLSWGFGIGGEASPLEPTRLRHQLSGRVGWSYDFLPQRLRWTNLAVGALQQDSDHQFQFTPGVDSRLWIIWQPRIRSLVQFEVFQFPSWLQTSFRASQAFDLSEQLEFRLGWREFTENTHSQVEKTLSFHQNFLF